MDNLFKKLFFDVEVAEQGVKIPITQYAERKDILIRPYEEGRWVQLN